MKAKSIFLLAIVFFTPFFIACDDDDNGRQATEIKNSTVNEWIYEDMNLYYYWRDKMPAKKFVDFTVNPYDFFDNLLYPFNSTTYDGDRFSWIQSSYVDLMNALSGVSSNEIGFDYIPKLLTQEGSNVIFIVTYIKKGTKAESSGLKRGDVINKVDGIALNTKNWSELLYKNKSSYKLEGLNFSGSITIEPTAKYNENPIYLEKVFTEGSKKIGYVVYNQFIMDNGDDSYIYDKQLADIFTKYNAENVTYLVLDLRYNLGGYTSCATNLASALIPNRDTQKKFNYKEFNNVLNDYVKKEFSDQEYDLFINEYFEDNIKKTDDKGKVTNMGSIPNYGNKITKLYVLVGENTASSSELVINGLRPFMKDKIFLIGETTSGKNVGSFTLTDENNKNNKWGMQPIVFKSFNEDKQSDYAAGFTPGDQIQGTKIYEFSNILADGLKPLGDKDEPLLAYAISDATGKSKSTFTKRLQTPPSLGKLLRPESDYRMVQKNFLIKKLMIKRALAY